VNGSERGSTGGTQRGTHADTHAVDSQVGQAHVDFSRCKVHRLCDRGVCRKERDRTEQSAHRRWNARKATQLATTQLVPDLSKLETVYKECGVEGRRPMGTSLAYYVAWAAAAGRERRPPALRCLSGFITVIISPSLGPSALRGERGPSP
jgi:hypothetical protein